MKRFSIAALFLLATLLVSACGAKEVPTAAPVDLQGTIAAAAFTVVAETQAAIPTATPVPPTATSTDTPLPTLTPLVSSTSALTFTPTPNNSSGGQDPCVNATLPATLKGKPVRVRIDNSTKVTVNVSVYLNQNGPQTVCGYRSYSLTPGQFIVLNDLVEGCYTLWAWNPDPDGYFMVTNGTSCIVSTDNPAFDISTSSIKLRT